MDKDSIKNLSGKQIKEMLNSRSVTLDELDVQSLEKLLNYETDMLCFDEGDMDIINRCSELLNSIDGAETMGNQEVAAIIDRTCSNHITITETKPKTKKSHRRTAIFRKIALVAAIMVLTSSATLAVTATYSVDVNNYFGRLVHSKPGTTIETGDFEFYIPADLERYDSVEQLFEAKKDIDIMYPTKWPKGIVLEEILTHTESNGTWQISFRTDNVHTGFTVRFGIPPREKPLNSELYVFNGIEFHIVGDKFYNAFCYIDGKEYNIHATNKDYLISIIESIKE